MPDDAVEILLVEDNPYDLELALDALREHNLANHIQVARDGAEALDFVFRTGAYANRPNQRPRLFLLDLKLPKVNGLEVLERIRANPETEMIPVVMLTSSQEERDVTASYRLHINSYIVKPVNFEQFSQVVREIGFYWLLLNHPPTP